MSKRDTLLTSQSPSFRLYGVWQLVRRMYPLWITIEAVLLIGLTREFIVQLHQRLDLAVISGFMALCVLALLVKTTERSRKDGR